jgi:hypothetical protein
VEPKVEPKVEPEIDAKIPPTADSVREALMAVVRRTVGGHGAAVVVCGLGAVIALVPSLRHVGARAPVDLRFLCVVIAFAIGGVMSFLAMLRTAAFLAGLTAQDLIGVTPRADTSLWLHFRNGRTLMTPPGNFDLARIEAVLPRRPPPPKIRPAALLAWAAFLAPLGVGLWLHDVPVPAPISQVESTGGQVQLTGNAVLIPDAFFSTGGTEYGTLSLSDGTGQCRVLVPSDAIPATERIRHEPGVPVRVEVRNRTMKLQVKGAVFDKRVEVLIAYSFEVLEP